jgi:hypothetical protein
MNSQEILNKQENEPVIEGFEFSYKDGDVNVKADKVSNRAIVSLGIFFTIGIVLCCLIKTNGANRS